MPRNFRLCVKCLNNSEVKWWFSSAAIADALACDVSVAKDKKAVLDCLESEWVSQRVHTDKHSCGLHVLPIGKLTLGVSTT